MTHTETPATPTAAVRKELQERLNTLGKDYGRYQHEISQLEHKLREARRRAESTRELVYQYGETLDVLADLAGDDEYANVSRVTVRNVRLGPFEQGQMLRVLYEFSNRDHTRWYYLSDDLRLPKFTDYHAAESFLEQGHTVLFENPDIRPA